MTSVCVVDNEELTARALSGMFRDLLSTVDYKVLDPAIRAQEVPTGVDVVICDLHLMPSGEHRDLRGHLSGSKAVRYLVMERDAQVLAMSGHCNDETVVAALAAGARSFVSKHGGYRSHIWQRAVEAAAEGRYSITAQLAATLRKDARARPLMLKGFSEQDEQFLSDVISAADKEELLSRKWDTAGVRRVLTHVWQVCKRRDDTYRFELSERLLQIAPLFLAGMTSKEIEQQLGLAKNTVQHDVSTLRKRWLAVPGRDDRKVLHQKEVLRLLYQRYLDEQGLK